MVPYELLTNSVGRKDRAFRSEETNPSTFRRKKEPLSWRL